MSLFNSYDRSSFLGELLVPLDTQAGVLTAAQQQAKARTNLGIGAGGALPIATVDATGHILSSGAVGGIGYSTGAGGTVTQATSKAQGVSLNTLSGAITMNAAALAAATIVSFVLTDTSIAATDVLILNHISGGTVGSYSLNAQAAAGNATINVRNNSAGSLSEAIVIQFVVIKGVNS